MDKLAIGEVLSNLDQVFFDLPAAAGTPPGLSSGSQPYWGGVNYYILRPRYAPCTPTTHVTAILIHRHTCIHIHIE